MKKKFFSLILAIAMFIPCMFALTACGSNPPDEPAGHTHTACATCGLCTASDCDGQTSEKCQGHTPPPAEPQLMLMYDYFSGVKISYKKESFSDHNYHSATFEELLDNQIDILAQDIVNRLNYIYGDVRATTSNYGTKYNLKDLENNNFSYNSNNAVSDSNKMLTTLTGFDADTYDEFLIINIDNIDDYQKSLLVENEVNNSLANNGYMNFISAMSGKYMSVEISGRYKDLSDETNTNKAWAIQNLDTMKSSLKLAIAKIMSGDNSASTYDQKLAKINSLSISSYADEIVEYINSNIVGTSLVNKDNEYYTYLKTSSANPGVIDVSVFDKIDTDDVYADDGYGIQVCTDSPRLYKGYKVIIPALVNQALANTFESTTTSIYSSLNRYAVESTDNPMGFVYTKNYESVVLMQKANTLMTKLVVNIAEATSITAQVNVVINGIDHKTTKTLISGENIIDLNTLTSGATLSAYSGNSYNDTQTNLFGTTLTGTNNNGNNYIELSFDGTQAFQISFSGYYDINA